MPPTYPNTTTLSIGGVTNTPIPPFTMSVPTAMGTDFADTVNTCDCEALRTAVILFSGMNAGMLAIGVVWVLFRRSKWVKKGAQAKQAEYDKIKGEQKERKGLLWRLADAL